MEVIIMLLHLQQKLDGAEESVRQFHQKKKTLAIHSGTL